jgi:BirA family biotin operon repressor/biotin-[acetyl-CoA-carboxylase] ligase
MIPDLEMLQRALPWCRFEWRPVLDSTMTEAARLAAAGAPAYTVVIAGEQTAGIGRFGRHWHSEPGAGLYMTWILRPRLESRQLPVVTLALGAALADAVEQTSSLQPDLRWPNDLLLNGRKCAGILVQLQEGALLSGIGVNIAHREFPAEIAHLATSLFLEAGDRAPGPESLIATFAPLTRRAIEKLESDGPAAAIQAFRARSSYAEGKRVMVELEGSSLLGTTAGLTADGFLKLRLDDGSETVILAGGVRPA